MRTDFTGGGDGAYALALHPNGKLTLAGYATEPGDIDSWVPAVARYESDGDLDPSFSGDGRRTVDSLASVLHGNAAYGLVARQNGGVVLAGRWGLLGFAANGSLDSAFGDAGRGLGMGGLDSVRGLVAQPDGWLIAVGSSDLFSGDFQVSRLEPGRLPRIGLRRRFVAGREFLERWSADRLRALSRRRGAGRGDSAGRQDRRGGSITARLRGASCGLRRRALPRRSLDAR